MSLSVIAVGLEAFAAANVSAAESISAAGTADSAAMLGTGELRGGRCVRTHIRAGPGVSDADFPSTYRTVTPGSFLTHFNGLLAGAGGFSLVGRSRGC